MKNMDDKMPKRLPSVKDIDDMIAEIAGQTGPQAQTRLLMLTRMKANAKYLQKLSNLEAEKPGLKIILQKKGTDVYLITFDGESGWWVDAISRDSAKVESIKDLVDTGGTWVKPDREFNPYILGIIAEI